MKWLIAAMLVALAGQVHAQEGRQVPTETIVVPEGERDMPEIPVDSLGDDAADSGGAPPAVDAPEVMYDPAALPEAVRLLRERLMAAARSGDLENLRPIIDGNIKPPALSFGHVEDPIDYLRSLSGDSAGHEILAILLEVLEAGFVHVDQGTPDEMYVWPYFARYPVDALTPVQLVELFKLVYAGDYEDMLAYGYYLSYRLGIGADGTWRYFIAGD